MAERPAVLWGEAAHHGGQGRAAVAAGSEVPARPRLAGLDGLRAVAVLAVVVFHLDAGLLPGGFLGVDVFFTISGFLITNLLVGEILETGTLRLGSFYRRRARRLLPTVFAVLAVVLVASLTFWRDQLPMLRGGVLSSLAYVTNWWLIGDHQSYFVASGRPSMLQHLLSLAIEEQFYLLWSVAVLVILGRAAARGRPLLVAGRLRLLVLTAVLLAVLSTVLMAVVAVHTGVPYRASSSRVYFGSDTHSMGLFLGSAAGAWVAARRDAARSRGPARGRAARVALTDVIGCVALVAVARSLLHIDEFDPQLYRGGFLLFGGLALVVILCATAGGSVLGRMLDVAPLRWIGRRSYSVYVWHWPIIVVTRPGLDVHGPVLLINVLRCALIIAVAALSYRLIEAPLRSGTFARRRSPRASAPRLAPDTLVAAVAGVGLLVAAIPVLLAHPAPARPPTRVASAHHPAAGSGRSVMAASKAAPTPASPHPSAGPSHSACRPAAGAATTKAKPKAVASVSAFGDSVLLGAGPTLQGRIKGLQYDAVEGRQSELTLNAVAAAERAHTLGPDVIIHTGNNGIISPSQLSSTLGLLAGRHRVLLVNDRVPRDWQDPNNQTISSVGARFHNVTVVNWLALSRHHSSWFYSDGLHLTPAGAAGYTAIMAGDL